MRELNTVSDKAGLFLHFRNTLGKLSIQQTSLINQTDEFLCSVEIACNEVSASAVQTLPRQFGPQADLSAMALVE